MCCKEGTSSAFSILMLSTIGELAAASTRIRRKPQPDRCAALRRYALAPYRRKWRPGAFARATTSGCCKTSRSGQRRRPWSKVLPLVPL
ncbi:unnamed protein product [Durusdinium trenchii]|uniref:Secreted protein n=2 Tax=Durusdinium trenchii TaxID=1381693 RepID=A0ABP0P4Y6_9DINO